MYSIRGIKECRRFLGLRVEFCMKDLPMTLKLKGKAPPPPLAEFAASGSTRVSRLVTYEMQFGHGVPSIGTGKTTNDAVFQAKTLNIDVRIECSAPVTCSASSTFELSLSELLTLQFFSSPSHI